MDNNFFYFKKVCRTKVEIGRGGVRPKEHLIVTYKSLAWLVEEVIHILNLKHTKTKTQIPESRMGNIQSTFLDSMRQHTVVFASMMILGKSAFEGTYKRHFKDLVSILRTYHKYNPPHRCLIHHEGAK